MSPENIMLPETGQSQVSLRRTSKSDSEKTQRSRKNSGCQQLSTCGVGSCSSIDMKFGKLGVQQFTCI